jgi:SAM-dependent methyltransferase
MPLGVIRLGGGSSLDKAAGIVAAFPGIWEGLVLDVGCRGQELRLALDGRPVDYLGLDLRSPADIIADLDDGIPLADAEADVVVALDVLEHVDGIHAAFAELCRVARGHVMVALPNGYVVNARWRQLRGRAGGKYGLPTEPPPDRHRWLFSLDDARAFCRHRAELAGWRVAAEAVMVGPRRRRVERLVRAWPNLFSPSLVVHLIPGCATTRPPAPPARSASRARPAARDDA